MPITDDEHAVIEAAKANETYDDAYRRGFNYAADIFNSDVMPKLVALFEQERLEARKAGIAEGKVAAVELKNKSRS